MNPTTIQVEVEEVMEVGKLLLVIPVALVK